jgi:acyl-CoA synthetase (AMP-forming)/AMP-acid ligase II
MFDRTTVTHTQHGSDAGPLSGTMHAAGHRSTIMIFRSPYPDVAIPGTPLVDFLLEPAARLADKPAIIDATDGRTLTYAELADAVNRAAAGFIRRGIRKGDVVALDSPNSPDYVIAFLGLARAGAIITTISPLFTAEELGKQLAHSRARLLITIPPLIGKASAAQKLSAVEEIYVFGEAEGATPFADLLGEERDVHVPIDPREDIVVMPYSSGTTGMPKGVMLTHRNLVANLVQVGSVECCQENETILGVLPFFHIYGMVVVMGIALRAGATLVTMSRFDLEGFLTALQTYGVTRVYLVPPIILALAKHPIIDRFDLSSLRNIMSGAAPLGADVQETCARRVDCHVRQGYGLTETSPVTHVTPTPPGANKPGSVGPVAPDTEMIIADLVSGEPKSVNEEGEVWVRGPQVMKGYFDNPDATAAMITEDGWLRTGDIGYADEDGYLFIVDRAKELIKYKGFQVAPAEIEALLLTHPAIADVAVIGVPDEEAGEVPMAFIVRAKDVTEESILEFVANNVAPYKKVRYIEFRESIPKSPSGKILRRVLRAEQRAKRGG